MIKHLLFNLACKTSSDLKILNLSPNLMLSRQHRVISKSRAFSSQGNVFQDAVFNQTVTITEKEDGLDGET